MKLIKFNSLIDILHVFSTEQSCINYLEKTRWPNGVVSPYDAKSKVYRYRNNRYRCKNTGKDFNVKTNTLFHGTHIPLQKWFIVIYITISFKKGISSTQLAKEINVTQKTAWFMLQRIRECFFCENQDELDNEVEIDETFIGGKNKNRHTQNKVKKLSGRNFPDKSTVLGMLERGGKIICRVIKDSSKRQIIPHILKHIKRSAVLYTDEWYAYRSINHLYIHYIVDHSKKQYVYGTATTNAIEGFWSIIKRSIIGVYHNISKKHLHRYINEYVFRFNTRSHQINEQFNLLLCNIEYRITYKKLTDDN